MMAIALYALLGGRREVSADAEEMEKSEVKVCEKPAKLLRVKSIQPRMGYSGSLVVSRARQAM